MVGVRAGLDGTESVHGAVAWRFAYWRQALLPWHSPPACRRQGARRSGRGVPGHGDPCRTTVCARWATSIRPPESRYTAGHCRGTGNVVTDKDRNVIGHLATFRDNTPSGSTVATDQAISDYEAIVLDGNVAMNNILPGGRALVSSPNIALAPGQPICHFGVVHR